MDKKALLGPLFPILSKAKHSRATRLTMSLSRWPHSRWCERVNHPYYITDIRGTKGLGALMCDALLICQHAERKKLTPLIISSNRLYCPSKKVDFLGDLFDQPLAGLSHMPRRPIHLHTLWDMRLLGISEDMSLNNAHRLLTTYFSPTAEVVKQISYVLAKIPSDHFDLTIHYRGTDKHLEAPAVTFTAVDDAVRRYIKEHPDTKTVFLATDELKFETHFRAQFPELHVLTYFIGRDVDSTRGRHFASMPPEEKAQEAIVNMFLLARAPMCIRTSSYLSAMSRIINPALKTETLSLTHWGSTAFPEKQIIEQEQSVR